MKRKALLATILVISVAIAMFFITVPACYPSGKTFEYHPPTSEQIIAVQDQVTVNGSTVIGTSGESMSPVIASNSECRCIKSNSYKIGDIVAYHQAYNQTELVMHRIVGILPYNEINFITRGDGNLYDDDYTITANNILCSVPSVNVYQYIGGVIANAVQ